MYENCLIGFLACTAAALQMTGPSTYTASVGSIAHIPCTFTADTLPADPRYFTVDWYLDGNIILSQYKTVTTPDPRYSLDKDRALNGNADLTISNALVSDAGDYTCSVIFSPARIQINIRVDITATPAITIENKVVNKNIKSNLKSTVFRFYPMDIDIKWLRDGQTLDNVIIEKPQRNPDGTYSVNSSVITIPTEEDRERIFSCRVQHKSLIAPLQEDFRLLYSVQPQLSILTKIAQSNTESTLACMVTGFFPPDIDVTWYKDGEVLNDQRMGKPHKNDNGTYQVISTVTLSNDDQNRNFSCRVQHISLQEPLQESFILQDSSTSTIVFRIALLLCFVCSGIIVTTMWKQIHWRQDSSCYAINILDMELLENLGILVCLVNLVAILISLHRRQDSSSYTIYIIVIAIVLILLCSVRLVTIGVIMWKQIHWRKDEFAASSYGTDKWMEEGNGRQNYDNDKRYEDEEKIPLITNKGQLPDLEVGEITVPKLIEKKIAALTCKLYNYIHGKHTCSWYVKAKSGDEIHIEYDKKKIQMTNKDVASDNQNTYIAYLALVPVEDLDDGSEFILRVNLPDRVIERSSGAVHVRANPQRLTLLKERKKNNPVHKDTWGWNTAALTATSSKLEQNDEEENAECCLYIDLDHKDKNPESEKLNKSDSKSLTPPY